MTVGSSGPTASLTCVRSPVVMVRKRFVRSHQSYAAKVKLEMPKMSDIFDYTSLSPYFSPPLFVLLFLSLICSLKRGR